MLDVRGFCPMGCGQTLHLGEGGYLYCRKLKCPDPSAASEVLDDRETEHVVTFTLTGFTIRHPLKERLGDKLLTCDLQELLSAQTPPQVMGRYRSIRPEGGAWYLERLGP